MNNIPFGFFDIEVEDETVWFVNAYYPALFSYNMSDESGRLETMLPSVDGVIANSYGPIKKYGNLLIIAPRCAEWILLYDIVEKSVEKIEIDLEVMKKRGSYNFFSSAVVYNECVYFFPGRYPAIVKLNIHTKIISYINDWYFKIKETLKNESAVIFRDSYRNGKTIYFPGQSGIVMTFDLTTEKCELIHCMNDDTLSSIDVVGDRMVYSFRDKDLVVINDALDVPNCSEYAGMDTVSAYNDTLFFFPIKGGCIQKYNLLTEEWSNIIELPKSSLLGLQRYKIFDCNFLSVKKISNRIFISSTYDGKMLVLDMKNDNIEEYELHDDDKDLIEYSLALNIVQEREGVTFKSFLEEIGRIG